MVIIRSGRDLLSGMMQAMIAHLVSGKLGRPTPSYTSPPSPDGYPGRAPASQAGSRSMVSIGLYGKCRCSWSSSRAAMGTRRTSTAQATCPPFSHALRNAGSVTSTRYHHRGTLGNELSSCPRASLTFLQSIIWPLADPLYTYSALVVLRGNLFLHGCVLEASATSPALFTHGHAVVFTSPFDVTARIA